MNLPKMPNYDNIYSRKFKLLKSKYIPLKNYDDSDYQYHVFEIPQKEKYNGKNNIIINVDGFKIMTSVNLPKKLIKIEFYEENPVVYAELKHWENIILYELFDIDGFKYEYPDFVDSDDETDNECDEEPDYYDYDYDYDDCDYNDY